MLSNLFKKVQEERCYDTPMDEESKKWYKIGIVQKMQQFILEHAGEEFLDFEEMYAQTGYSKRHADRYFKEFLGKTPKEYFKLIRLSDSAKQLVAEQASVLDAALDADFESHEGYTKAFRETFGKLPSEYKRGKHFIPLFVPYPINDYYNHIYGREKDEMEKNCLCMVTPVQRPKRKLIFLRSKEGAKSYWNFCQEMSCEWEGLLNSNQEKFDTAAFMMLPESLGKEGQALAAAGIEVPIWYDGEIPEGYEVAELEPCDMLYFQSQKYEKEDEFVTYMKAVEKAMEEYDYEAYGFKRDETIAPTFNFGADAKHGAKMALPVRRV